MRLTALSVSLGLTCLAPLAGAQAADWNNGSGGIKDYALGGVAVPAPIPLAEGYGWYLRGDIGIGLLSGGGAKESGLVYGLDRDPADGPAFGTSSSWFHNEFDSFALAGVGVGAYFTNRWRGDITVDGRTSNSDTANASYSYNQAPAAPGPATTRVVGTVYDKSEVHSILALANLYYDFANSHDSRFVPYVGLGVGTAIRSVSRSNATNEAEVDIATNTTTLTRQYGGSRKTYDIAPAAAATVGLAYTIKPGILLDVNYRFTYLGSVEFSTQVANQSSRLQIGDTFEHALRAGIRWNVW